MILSLETSTFFSSVALHENGTMVASRHNNEAQSTASQLSVMIDQVCRQAGIVQRQLKAVAVSAGPGSYTGLRIGVATAKGVCAGLQIPLVAVNSLDLLAAQVQPLNSAGGWLCPMFDARRMEVYTRLYSVDLAPLTEIEAKIIDDLSYADVLSGHHVLFFGSGAEKCQEVIKHANASFLLGITPSAEKLGELADEKFIAGEFERVDTYEPFYLKDFMVKKPKALQ